MERERETGGGSCRWGYLRQGGTPCFAGLSPRSCTAETWRHLQGSTACSETAQGRAPTPQPPLHPTGAQRTAPHGTAPGDVTALHGDTLLREQGMQSKGTGRKGHSEGSTTRAVHPGDVSPSISIPPFCPSGITTAEHDSSMSMASMPVMRAEDGDCAPAWHHFALSACRRGSITMAPG